jgi:hypothetical protein
MNLSQTLARYSMLVNLLSFVSSVVSTNSKSVPSPSLLIEMMSRFNSNTDIPVPSNVTRVGSFCDLNRKKTEDAMMMRSVVEVSRHGLSEILCKRRE